jgi:DNA-binding transcriptional MerR regulator
VRRKLTIGELARRTGVTVKTLRFYSDEGLLPPAGRSRSGYRLYTEEHVFRIDLIRTLREAGVGLEDVGKVLRRDVPLAAVLELRLGAVEAHIAGLQRIASALRLAIQSGGTEEDLRRISMVTRASNEDRRRIVAAFYNKVMEGLPVEPDWVRGWVEAVSVPLPDDAKPEQLAAWVELQKLMEEPSFAESRRASAAELWTPAFRAALGPIFDVQYDALSKANEARLRGVSPTAPEAGAIVERFTAAMVAAAGHADARAIRAHMRAKYDPRGARYWELVAIMRGESPPIEHYVNWRWIGEAIRHHTESLS